MNAIKQITLCIAISGVFALTGCSDSGSSNPTGSNNPQVLQARWQGADGIGLFFAQRCTPCHTSQSQNGFNVSNYDNIMSNGDIIAGNATGSYLILKLTGDPNAGERMPQGGPYLTSAEVDSVMAWIQAGALNN